VSILYVFCFFVISQQTTSKIHKNYNFNRKFIIPLGFDL